MPDLDEESDYAVLHAVNHEIASERLERFLRDARDLCLKLFLRDRPRRTQNA
jgi:hypothetical protein